VIVFTSDHGDGQGAHRLNQKTHFYEEIARIPFIISWKNHTPTAVNRDHLVNMGLDLFPTLLDFAGIPIPQNLHGKSAAPVALGKANAASRPYVVAENHHHHKFGIPGEVDGRMVRSQRYKYIRYNRGQPCELLFDLQADPHELCNLAPNAAAAPVLTAHRAMLDEYIRSTGDSFPPAM
jgi:arylsulfatase A-like enzyme